MVVLDAGLGSKGKIASNNWWHILLGLLASGFDYCCIFCSTLLGKLSVYPFFLFYLMF